jgi:hypothetical protein
MGMMFGELNLKERACRHDHQVVISISHCLLNPTWDSRVPGLMSYMLLPKLGGMSN